MENIKVNSVVQINENGGEGWVKENLGLEDVYCGGSSNLQIRWLPVGTAFQVEEYDGFESLRTMADLCIVA